MSEKAVIGPQFQSEWLRCINWNASMEIDWLEPITEIEKSPWIDHDRQQKRWNPMIKWCLTSATSPIQSLLVSIRCPPFFKHPRACMSTTGVLKPSGPRLGHGAFWVVEATGSNPRLGLRWFVVMEKAEDVGSSGGGGRSVGWVYLCFVYITSEATQCAINVSPLRYFLHDFSCCYWRSGADSGVRADANASQCLPVIPHEALTKKERNWYENT